jgi:hypothetical protein
LQPSGIQAWTSSAQGQYHTVSEQNKDVESSQNLSAGVAEAAGTPGVSLPKQVRVPLEPWFPDTEAEKSSVLAQLDLLVAHPLFFQSKRYPALLRFVVEQTLEGNADQVKERSIGMEVFNRAPGYDANADPVVRVTAGEIRKRLAQYYYDPSHSDELRIELPTGSYVPVFQRFAESANLRPALPTPDDPAGVAGRVAQAQIAATTESVPAPQSAPQFQSHGHPVLILLLFFVTLLLGLGGGYWLRQYRQLHAIAPQTTSSIDQAVDDFWQPMTAGPATVTICLGEPARDSSGDDDPSKPIQRTKPTEPLYFRLRQSGLFALADTVTLTRLTAPLQKQHKAFRVSAASEASYAQLREGPAVLIGAFDNLWTMRLTRDLRFGFDSIDGNAVIVDRRKNDMHPSARTTWATAWDLPYERLARDYAIVARFRDSMTGQPMVIAAGISEEGTEAAGELITKPNDLAELLRNAPANWRTMNMEAIIETQVIDGHAGPPQVRAVEFW